MMSNINQPDSSVAQDLAGKAILFEIGARAGILDLIESKSNFTINELSKNLRIGDDFLVTYLETLESLNLLTKDTSSDSHDVVYSKSAVYAVEKNKIGYIAWGMISCAPLIENAAAFTRDFDTAVKRYHRCGEHVAQTSKWMGEKDFYPHAENAILKLQPKKMVDLGSGTCGLLIRLAKKINGLKGVGVDISRDACEMAKVAVKQADFENQIDVIESSIQDLIANENVFLNADVIHAGFVFHDLLPDEEDTLNLLLKTICNTAPKATLIVVDAVPFSQNIHERAFSGAFTFLHKFFMGRRLLSESEWQVKLNQAGFKKVLIEPLGISGGRIFVANN